MTNEELIRNYKFVNKLMITHGDLVELIEMREEIVENLILNTKVLIKKYTRNDEDLYQNFLSKFVQIIDKFDISKGYKFSTYMISILKFEIMKYNKLSHELIPRSALDIIYKFKLGDDADKFCRDNQSKSYTYESLKVALDLYLSFRKQDVHKTYIEAFEYEEDKIESIERSKVWDDLSKILSKTECKIVKLRMENFSYPEIVKLLNISSDTYAQAKYSNAIKKIKNNEKFMNKYKEIY